MKLKTRMRSIYQKLTCPVISSCIIISFSYFAFLTIIPSLPYVSQIYYNDSNASKVELATKKIRNYCGEKYFTVWMTLQMNKSRDKFLFKEIKGCQNTTRPDCSFDVKVFNPYYSKSHFLDSNTYSFINKFSNEDVFYTKDMTSLKQYQTIKDILVNTNKELTGLGLKVVKDIRNKIIYVFSITHLEGAKKCDRKKIAGHLDDLNRIVREGI